MKHALLGLVALSLFACSSETTPEEEPEAEDPPFVPGTPADFDPGAPYAPSISADDLSPNITNPRWPSAVGTKWTYQAQTEDGVERIEVEVLAETHDVAAGATGVVIRDTVYVDDEMVEDTWDWYAQDEAGNVWYLGEDTYEYDNGEVLCSCGAWEWGVDGALPGIIALADPEVGNAYRQEYLAGVAEDYAVIVSTTETVTVPMGTFDNCVKTHDQSALDPEVSEYKYTCPGVGVVLEEEDDERVELIAFSTPTPS